MTQLDTPRLPTLAEHVSLHIAGEHGLILDAQRQMLYSASPADTLLLCCLVEEMPRAAVIEQLSRRLEIPDEQARRRLSVALSMWRKAGLFDDDRRDDAAADAAGPAMPDNDATNDDAANDGADDRLRYPTAVPGGPYRMLDTIFTVAFENAGLRDAADPAVGQLESCDLPEEPVHLEIGRYEDGFAIFAGGRMYAWCERFDQLPLMLLSTVNRIAVFRSGAFCAIHAGAVRIRSGCALLVGPAGVGKSTLVAGLATSGYEALCDDTVLLADDALDVRPVRGGVWIKRGSWPVLSRRFPALGGTPERLRPDGIRVRQLPVTVDPSPPADGDRLPAQRIVFPCFDASAQPAIEPLEPAAALRNLTANLYLLDRRLDPPAIERLIGWISEVPCFRIRYPSLDSAIDQFRGIAR